MTKLANISDYLNTLLATFSPIINLEFTILNADPMERIAATGAWQQIDIVCYENGQLVPVWKNSYTAKVIETGKPLVAIDTGAYVYSHPKMQEGFDSRYYSVLAHPLWCMQKLEGVLVIASFDERQQRFLIEKQEQLMEYLREISVLISNKLEQECLLEETQVLNNHLNSILEAMEDGIILYSPEKNIFRCNIHAEKYLHFNAAEMKGDLLSKVLNLAERTAAEGVPMTREVAAEIDGFQYLLCVKTKCIAGSDGSVLCIISPFSQIQNDITQNEEQDNGLAENIVFFDEKMRRLVRQAKVVAHQSSNVLISGESGTGKEMFARLIHSSGPRKAYPFVAINCAAIPETLMESELFGYEEGAFTGARKGGKIGKLQLANKGTFFLDEIGDMPLYLQAKLLRVLSEKKIDRIGSTSSSVSVDIRIIAATNQNLEEMIKEKTFREDLYYRLNVVPLHLPPLRERLDDIPFLIQHFIKRYNKILKKEIKSVSDSTLSLIMNYPWPGNVRELENCVEYMMTFETGDVLSPAVLPQKIASLTIDTKQISKSVPEMTLMQPLKDSLLMREQEILKSMMKKYGGHPSKEQAKEICSILGISVASYYRKIKDIPMDDTSTE